MIFGKKKKKESPLQRLQKKGTSEEEINLEDPENLEKNVNPPGSGPKLKKKEKVSLKKEKDDSYIMKKNSGMKVLRILFWLMLLSIFFRGMFEILKPTKVSEITSIINDFKEEQKLIGDHPEELMKFAQDFAKEYLTYNQSGESDFRERIKPYVSKRIYNLSGIYGFKNSTKATYVNAYRKEVYSSNQYDVYVNAEVQYDQKNLETGEIKQTMYMSTLKIPVTITESGYSIEGLPLFVSDKRLDQSYNPEESIPGTEIDNKLVEPALTNFMDAYYSQDQSMINYLLTSDADKSKFIGLSKRYLFEKIDSVRAYMTAGNEIICILKVKIRDAVNEEIIYQEFNVQIIQPANKKSIGN